MVKSNGAEKTLEAADALQILRQEEQKRGEQCAAEISEVLQKHNCRIVCIGQTGDGIMYTFQAQVRANPLRE